jgi:hypothetical protein
MHHPADYNPIQNFPDVAAHCVSWRTTCDCFGSEVPESNAPVGVSKRQTFGERIQRRFQQVRAIRHT